MKNGSEMGTDIATAFFEYVASFGHSLWAHLRPSLTLLLRQSPIASNAEDRKPHFTTHNAAQQPRLEKKYYTVTQPSAVALPLIQKLPAEILGEIFAWCIPVDLCNSTCCDAAPLLLLRVCKTWSRVALNTPQLWTKLVLHGLQGVDPLVFISTWLQRSGALPIDVYINPLTWYYPTNIPLFKSRTIPDAAKLLATEFHRIRTLHITNLPAVMRSFFPEDNHVLAPFLRDLRITSVPKLSEEVVAGAISAPNLESLDVIYPHVILQSTAPNYRHLLSFRWDGSNGSQLRHAFWSHLVPFLRSCPNLEECEIIRPGYTESFPRLSSANPTITLPRLRKLSLLWNKNVDIVDFLQLLELPMLESLRLEMEHTTSHANLQHVLGVLFPCHRPPPPLKELHAVHLNIIISDDTLPQHAHALSLRITALERLRLEDCSLHNGFLMALAPETDTPLSTWCLPNLAELHLSRVKLDTSCLAHIVAARTRSLNMISLHDCHVSEMDAEMLREVASRGTLSLTL